MFQAQNSYQYPMAMPQQPQTQMAPRNAATLYIGDLDEQINEEMLYLRFSQYGQIFTLKIANDLNKKSRGFAFVTYYNKSDGKIINFNNGS